MSSNSVFFGSALIRPPKNFPEVSINFEGLKVVLAGFLKKCGPEQYCSVIRVGGKQAIVGSPVLESLYIIVDRENSKIALTPVKKCEAANSLVRLNYWERFYPLDYIKILVMIISILMIILIGW